MNHTVQQCAAITHYSTSIATNRFHDDVRTQLLDAFLYEECDRCKLFKTHLFHNDLIQILKYPGMRGLAKRTVNNPPIIIRKKQAKVALERLEKFSEILAFKEKNLQRGKEWEKEEKRILEAELLKTDEIATSPGLWEDDDEEVTEDEEEDRKERRVGEYVIYPTKLDHM